MAKKLQRSGERARQDVRRGQEGYKATRLRNIPRRDIFRKDTKIIAVVGEMKLIVRHDSGVEESCLSKSSSCVDKAVKKKIFAVRNGDPTVSNA